MSNEHAPKNSLSGFQCNVTEQLIRDKGSYIAYFMNRNKSKNDGRQFQRFRQDNSDNPSEFIWTEYDLYYFTFCPLSASVQREERYPLEWRLDALRLRSSRAQWRSLMADQHPYDDAMEEWLSNWRQLTIEKWRQDKATNEKGFWKRFWGLNKHRLCQGST
ncbi:ATP-dependent RNA helicase DRS1 [Fusarium oxysporum f. sp. albedinis]|nr:ATP-dependent RNA helicase DRS1 [Fusarium oxysporum f. sp. albedinis]